MKKTTAYPQKLSRLNFFSRREAAEIPKLLLPDEQILGVLSGFYTAGTAVLCVTSKRILLIDKKIIRLSFEDVRFESVKEVKYSQQLVLASLKFYYAGRSMQFRSWFKPELRMLAQFVQNKMFETKNHHLTTATQSNEELKEFAYNSQAVPAPLSFSSPQMERYLQERIARWRRASRFVDNLPGGQVIRPKLEVPLEEAST